MVIPRIFWKEEAPNDTAYIKPHFGSKNNLEEVRGVSRFITMQHTIDFEKYAATNSSFIKHFGRNEGEL